MEESWRSTMTSTAVGSVRSYVRKTENVLNQSRQYLDRYFKSGYPKHKARRNISYIITLKTVLHKSSGETE